MNTVYIPNLEFKFWTRKSDLPLVNFLRYLTQPKITIQILFKITYIEHDMIKYEVAIMEHVEYNTDFGGNFMNVDDI